MSFVVIIPARFASTRLASKPLVDIHGKPMVVHMMQLAQQSDADRVIIATDHPDIACAVRSAGGEVCMTSLSHQSGTERICEVVKKYRFSNNTIIVNLQCDEPMIPPYCLNRVAANLERFNTNITTLAMYIDNIEKALNPNVVKVVRDIRGYALYFSRAIIPFNHPRSAESGEHIINVLLQHIGIYAYPVHFIYRYTAWTPCALEHIELLEQLRTIWYGEKIHVDVLRKNILNISVDTPEDLERARIAMIAK
ncbi:3-deoxy-manno-octulosonate cytidylyltransferase [Candidatus Pantoea carbekii]|uniref:3-deoxy-manno-octulosonate cytidylyltransferase n=1 Tax=Candidatus Pantoea carbekii TaxID=1235990 RepID=U3U8K2_9GAMM|nr:3-deoxy-manno-octulosonate cytidylyltransferase [Candidatus Pantoea carbekii]AKC32157.1 3-deoxy-manno-octulosonate cytidylyltransferase [Candidatus Pantoea carbekii]BAO00684.1 KdsB protein [Candidatus Pantoea carbekii]